MTYTDDDTDDGGLRAAMLADERILNCGITSDQMALMMRCMGEHFAAVTPAIAAGALRDIAAEIERRRTAILDDSNGILTATVTVIHHRADTLNPASPDYDAPAEDDERVQGVVDNIWPPATPENPNETMISRADAQQSTPEKP